MCLRCCFPIFINGIDIKENELQSRSINLYKTNCVCGQLNRHPAKCYVESLIMIYLCQFKMKSKKLCIQTNEFKRLRTQNNIFFSVL